MTINISQETLDEISVFINGGELVTLMNSQGMSAEAMLFVLQSLIEAVDNAQDKFDNLQ
jgi:hypothetical protein